MQTLNGRVALVTGGSRGIGAAIARALAAAGADVALSYVSSSDRAQAVVADIERGGRRAHAYQADNADAQQVSAFVEAVKADFGRIDILVNNAGMFFAGDLASQSLEDYERIMNVNVRAVFAAVQAAWPHMGQGGRIINIGSCLVERSARPGVSLYAASKAALVGLTKGLARDLGPKGITVNVVHPGPIDTDMNPADAAGAPATRQLLALPAYGRVEDIAGMVAYLASPAAGFVTGAAVSVDGGFTA